MRLTRKSHRAHLAAILVAAIAMLWLAWILLVPTAALNDPQEVTITEGQGVYGIAATLKEHGFIRNSNVFALYVMLRGWDRQLQAGDYSFPTKSSMLDIASELAQGRAISHDIEVVIPEGSNIWEVDRKLTQAGFSTGTSFAKRFLTKDGFFFPDTYRFKPSATIDEIAQRMEANFDARTSELLGNISARELNRIIIIASMLEKEAQTSHDMRLVSGVIRNRIAKGMGLEIDATVSYGTCVRVYLVAPIKDCQVNLVAVGTEVKIDSPFNTYTRKGLPPRPISNPGLAAIEAALHPEGDYLYYLSPRGGGDLIFSHTGAEHAVNRRKYLGL